ncbi:hypothetical protein BC833DRAFT_603085 [Globomyces pollinis-pini]|nr:hypothetical protein BC833DRAFT_603085 [Globomyces pollinis-pini]
MVYYFQSTATDPPTTIYMGKDKFENEELIKYGWTNDVWFHVDKLSSAHVYLRLQEGDRWDQIDEKLLLDIAQLTKANSIEGNKKDNICIIYTPWSNLKKTGDMDTGQVGFHKNKTVKRTYIDTRRNEIINRLNKTKTEDYPDLGLMKIQNEKMIRKQQRELEKLQNQAELEYIKEKQLEKKKGLNGYESLMVEEHMYSNKGLDMTKTAQELEDDFM